ncbi:hypothetical protein ABT278_00915 [Streptomyces sp. NPDC001228]|uniref:hypothetical protein n=1 Tax=Streptomyces sp. NPDC001228 TaxID=3154381 RepID=UPI00333479F7
MGEFTRTTAAAEEDSVPEDVSGRGGRPARLGCALLALAVLAGGAVWLLRDELFHPFGDDRACSGSDQRLPGAISAGGTRIPADASDVHYYVHNGSAALTFQSALLADYLRTAGLVPRDGELFAETYGTKGVAGEGFALPAGLCGAALRDPVFSYRTVNGVGVTVERSPLSGDSLRFPARAVITYPVD